MCKCDLLLGDSNIILDTITPDSIDLVVTSPPYYNAREYSHWDTYESYLEWLRGIFLKVFKSIKCGHMCCVNISVVIEARESRNSESKRLPIPFDFVHIMQEIGYKFLEDIIWVKPSGASKNRNGGFYRMRQPIQYKPNVVNEYIFVFQKPIDKLIDHIIASYSQNIRTQSLVLGDYEQSNVWYINPDSRNKHPAPFPVKLSDNLIKYYSYINDTVLDPFMGSGTVAVSCKNLNRNFIGIEIKDEYYKMAKRRLESNEVLENLITLW